MIEFLTLFLGIVAGPHDVALLVDDQITRVELRLDGETVSDVAGPPWETEVDLGTDLMPRILDAVGFGSDGRELTRATQLLNVPRPSAEASLMLHGGADGQLEARLTWENTAGSNPSEQIALLDEKEVPILAGHRVDLSGVDTRQLHVLQVELWFPDLASVRGHLVFGGEYVDETSAALTALPVISAKGTLKPSEMAGWFSAGAEALDVAAVEKGLAKIMIVRSPGVARLARFLPGRPEDNPEGAGTGIGPIVGRADASTVDLQRRALTFGDDFRVNVVVPRALETVGRQLDFDLFSVSPELRSQQGGMLWMLSSQIQVGGIASSVRLNDAVTLAGLQAAASNHRRAVLLVLAGPWEDHSRFEIAAVRKYLEALNVPLIVWHLGDEAPNKGDWGPRVEISDYGDLKRAWRSLEKRLNRQRIVWLEGIHLPDAVRIA